MTVSALLMKFIKAGGAQAVQFQQLLDAAQNLGLAEAPIAALNGARRA
jgi:hypothetical protein